MESDNLDEVDRQIIHVLALDPRASFRTIAEITGISDQTAARRFRRLTESAGLRILGAVNAIAAGRVDWLVRLQTTPGSADALADALARRPDTRWVRLFSGGTEITCVLQAHTPEHRNDLFLRGLPGSRRVVQMSAHSILHVFSPVAWPGYASALSADQIALLSARQNGQPDTPATTLVPADEPLLSELARDGRASNATLAKAIHWHESTVRRRIAELSQAGLLYFDVDIDEAAFGAGVAALFWLSAEPSMITSAGAAIAAHPEVAFAAATTGRTNLVASGLFRDTGHLYEYLTGPLAAIPGIRGAEISPVIGTLKRTGAQSKPRVTVTA